MNETRYETIIYWDPQDSIFVVEIPELPGCKAHGATKQDALTNIEEAASLWIESAKEDGAEIPEPRVRLMLGGRVKPTEHSTWLRCPAYGLYHLDSLEQSTHGDYLYDIVPTFQSKFDAGAQQNILAALGWAADCDTLNWEDILPGLPHSDDFKREHCRITRDRILKRQTT